MAQMISTTHLHGDLTVFEEKNKNIETNCGRCGGMLVSDRCYDLSSSGIFKIAIKRCVQCGDVIDPIILKHRHQATLTS